MSKTDNTNLRNLIQTLAPFVYVTTEEEGRFISWLRTEWGSRKKHDFKVWKRSKGLIPIDEYVATWSKPTEQALRPLPTANINDALSAMLLEATPMERHYYVILDAETLLDSRDPMTMRRVMDLAEQVHQCKETFKSYIFVSNRQCIPSKMERMFRVAEFELPGTDVCTGIISENLNSDYLVAKLSSKVDVPGLVKDCAGLTGYQVEQIVLESLTLHKTVLAEHVRAARIEEVKKNQMLELIQPETTFADVGGMDRLKAFLMRRKNAWTEAGKKYGLPVFRGVLAVGLPGNGKSLIFKALAHEYGIPLVKFDPSKLFGGQVGSSEANMRAALATLEKMAPVVAWMDEAEKGLAGMQSSTFSDSGTTARVIGHFLTWMQECKEDVILAATANDIQNLPPELLRRFDEIFFVGLPGRTERSDIFRIHIRKVGRDPSIYDIDKLVGASDQRSGAEIEKAISEAMYIAFDDGMREMTTEDILYTVRSKPPIVVTMAEQLRAITEWVGKDEATGDGIRARYAHALEAPVEMKAF